MSFLNKLDDILSIDDREVVTEEVPEWNTTVRLRAMTANDRDAFESHVSDGGKQGTVNLVGMRAKMVASCIVDEDGNRVIPANREAELGARSAAVLDRLFAKCTKLNGMTQEDEAELVSNFSDDQSEPSTSD